MLIFLLVIVTLLFGFMLGGLRGAVWVPARSADTIALLKDLNSTPNSHVFEFGVGDGRNLRLIHRALPKAKLSGIEINPLMWLIANMRAGHLAKINLGDGWHTSLVNQDIVITFLTPPFMARFEQKILTEMAPGSLVISYAFELPNLIPIEQKYNYLVYKIPSPSREK